MSVFIDFDKEGYRGVITTFDKKCSRKNIDLEVLIEVPWF